MTFDLNFDLPPGEKAAFNFGNQNKLLTHLTVNYIVSFEKEFVSHAKHSNVVFYIKIAWFFCCFFVFLKKAYKIKNQIYIYFKFLTM